MDHFLLISDAAKEVQVESHVLRYWEEELHLPIRRNELGHRYYTREDVERFKQIKGMKERGLQLKAIKMILRDGKIDVMMPEEEKEALKQQEELQRQESQEQEAKDDRTETGERARRPIDQEISGAEKGKAYRAEAHETGGAEKGKAGRAEAQGISGTEAGEISVLQAETGKILREVPPEEKAKRLQWLLQQMFLDTLQENNKELCRDIRESVVKELDYQFRLREEKEEERDRVREEREEAHFQKLDELLREKSHRKSRDRQEKRIRQKDLSREQKKQQQKPQKKQEERAEASSAVRQADRKRRRSFLFMGKEK